MVAKVDAKHDRVDLIIVQKAAPVQVGGANRRPDAVDQGGLGMQHRVATFKYFHAAFQQVFVVRPTNVKNQPGIGFGRQHHAHVNAAFGGRHQRVQQLRVRHEVGIGQQHLGFGAVDG